MGLRGLWLSFQWFRGFQKDGRAEVPLAGIAPQKLSQYDFVGS